MGTPSWLKEKSSENANLELARVFALALLEGKPYSRETLSQCYYSFPNNGEKAEVSELWINRFWSEIEAIPPKEWRHATGGEKSFVDFVMKIWGRD